MLTEQILNELHVPRLQIKCEKLGSDYRQTEWHYDLVYKHFTGDIEYVSLGKTKRETGESSIPLNDDGTINLPFRDGVHIKSDALELRLPAFAICGDVVQRINLTDFISKCPERVRL